MEEEDKMDMELTADFDSSLLTCWVSGGGKNGSNKGGNGSPPVAAFAPLASLTTDGDNADGDCAQAASSATSSKGTQAGFSREKVQQLPPSLPSDSSSAAASTIRKSPTPVSAAVSTTSAFASGGTVPLDTSRNPDTDQQRRNDNQHGIPANIDPTTSKGSIKNQVYSSSSSTMRPSYHHSSASLTPAGSVSSQTTSTQMHPHAIPSSANCPPHVVTAHHAAANLQVQSFAGLQNPLFPAALTNLGGPTAAAFVANLSLPTTTQLANSQTSNSNEHASTSGSALNQHPAEPNTAFFTQQSCLQQQQQAGDTASLHSQHQGSENNSSSNSHTGSRSNQNTTSQSSSSPPPFYLFDAPVELRVNFMQSQRMHGLPVTEDSNSYHYGVAVNGFHPQVNAQVNPTMGVGGGSSSSGNSHNTSSVQLVDARHSSSRRGGRIKNEREQRRAQKITELIDQLREKMETGGWKVEVKSKFHTLSSCADYVKHLVKVTREKEEAVNKAKADLQAKEQKVEEEKAIQEARSDPESVMSSLTSSTGGDSGNSGGRIGTARKISSEKSSNMGQRKRKMAKDGLGSGNSKRGRKCNVVHSGSSSSSSETQACQRSNQRSLDKATSSVSDMTDSNKCSFNFGSDVQNSNLRSDDDDESGTPSSISASSSAAVAQGRDGTRHRPKHADVVIEGRNSEGAEVTSLEDSFVLDYEEVFVKSNIPQLIATTAGRIISWNDFFLKATGITKTGIKGLTIFSLVKQEKLSNLFEIVAKALRDAPSSETKNADSPSGDSARLESTPKWDYSGMTLPCIDFPATSDGSPNGTKSGANPLYITVTLMADDDPRKRLFHCVFTDCPGTNNGTSCTIGSITPELLSLLFTRHHAENLEARKGKKIY